MRHLCHVLGAAVLVVLIAASAVAAFEPPREDFERALAGVPEGSVDHEFARLAERLPGFAGFYYDFGRAPTVVLSEPRLATAFERMGFRVQVGEYDFRQLLVWRVAARATMAHDAVVFLDIDETANRLRIGVDREHAVQATAAVEATLAALGLPAEAVVIEPTDPIVPMATLRERVRPVPGSMQIRFSNFVCTLGFNADREGVVGFVTNSHCSDDQGSTTGTVYLQPNTPEDNRIGEELLDPPYIRGLDNCPQGRVCRYSDSLFAGYDAAGDQEMAKIARTTGPNNGSLDIDDANPRFTITATGSSVVGEVVNKIGRTTGWTQGEVLATCVDVSVAGSNITQLCQDRVGAAVDGGDSGSPVFAWDGTGDNVELRGILWGGSFDGSSFTFSPFANITRDDTELGPLDVTGEGADGGGDPGDPGDPEATTMHVASIDAGVRTRGPWQNAVVTVTIHDDNGNPVSSAMVTGTFSGDVSGTVSGTTGSNGTVTFESERVRTSSLSYQFCVDDVTHDTLTYDAASNVETCDGV